MIHQIQKQTLEVTIRYYNFIINIIYDSQIQFIIKGYPIYDDILYRIAFDIILELIKK